MDGDVYHYVSSCTLLFETFKGQGTFFFEDLPQFLSDAKEISIVSHPLESNLWGKYRSPLGSCKQGSLQSPDYLVDSQLRTILIASVHKGLHEVIAHST